MQITNMMNIHFHAAIYNVTQTFDCTLLQSCKLAQERKIPPIVYLHTLRHPSLLLSFMMQFFWTKVVNIVLCHPIYS